MRGENFPIASTVVLNHPEHPRVRGENFIGDDGVYRFNGTSPRARGKRKISGCPVREPGNIPACAGKTIPATTFTNNAWEHPRVRGEN